MKFPQKKVIIIESHDSDSATASGLDNCSPSVVVSVQVYRCSQCTGVVSVQVYSGQVYSGHNKN